MTPQTTDDQAPGEYKAQPGTWTLTAPDGRQWTADSPLAAAGLEQKERIPAKVALARIMHEADTSKDSSGESPALIPSKRINPLDMPDQIYPDPNGNNQCSCEKVWALSTEVERLRNSLVQAGFSDCGGELWKPPLGPRPVFLDENLRLREALEQISAQAVIGQYDGWCKKLADSALSGDSPAAEKGESV
jgi:hypothetical protein